MRRDASVTRNSSKWVTESGDHDVRSEVVQWPRAKRSDMQLYTRKEIEERNRAENAAIIIDNIVYDVSKFLEDHPGGIEVLLNNAGKDASRCFHDVGHSEDAKLWRKEFKIGEVVEADRWEVISKTTDITEGEDVWTLRGLLDVWMPPLAFAAIAFFVYVYLF